MIVIVMGVAGSGKTTVGMALAEALGAAFLDADAFHSTTNIAKMKRGEALGDADREPWLAAMNRALREHERAGESVVLACSALKATYRRALGRGLADRPRVVYLRVGRGELHQRMTRRRGHFMPASLLDSQLAALEEPTEALVVDGEMQVEKVVSALVQHLTAE